MRMLSGGINMKNESPQNFLLSLVPALLSIVMAVLITGSCF